MKLSLARRRHRIVKLAMRSVLVMSAASLLFSCGGGGVNPELQPAAKAKVSKSLAPAVQCSDVATIAANTYHTVGLKEDGTVVAVGYSGFGELSVSWTNIKAIAAGVYHTVGLKEDGTVVAVGNNTYHEMNFTTEWKNIKAIAAGTYHTVGLKEDGTVVAVGTNTYHQMDFTTEWKNIKAIAAGVYHTVGLKEDGTVVAVGYPNYHEMDFTTEWTNIKAIAAGTYHTVGLKEDGTVVAVGTNTYHQMDVSSWTNIKAIAAGKYHTVGLKEDGTVVVAGAPAYDYGQLDVSSWTNIKAIAAGTYHTVGLKEDGTVEAVGGAAPYNYGQLAVSPSFTNIKPVCDASCVANQDVSPPITIATKTGTLGNNGWYVSDVQTTLTATDNDGSGVKEIHYTVDGTATDVQGSSASYSIAGNGTHAVTWYAIDNAGNVEPPQIMSIMIDKTRPTITATVSPPPNSNGWNNTDVTVTFTCSDSLSGIASCPASVTVTSEGAGQVITNSAVDKAGNSATTSVTLNIDKTRPTITAAVSPPPNANGWNNTDVTVTFTCGDSLSGIASCPAPITVTTEGAGQVITNSAVDKAGNSATTSVTLNIDKTPPSISSLSAGPSILWPPNHKMVNVLIGGSLADGGSGIASTTITVTDEYGSCNTTMIVSGLGGTIPLESWRDGTDMDGRLYTITAVVADKAGNRSTGTTTVLVPHDMR